MSNEEVLKYALFAFIAIFLIANLLAKKKPKEKTFVCARCKNESPHTERTIEAWRRKKSKFYCKSCHAKWVESQPRQTRSAYETRRSSGSGCLGFIVIFIAIPISYFIF